MNTYFKLDQTLPEYMPYPLFLLVSDLTLAAREVYALLLHRMTLSRLNRWANSDGDVFVIYPIEDMARDLKCSQMTVKRALKSLVDADLIERRRWTFNGANRIFIKMPTEQNCSVQQNKIVLTNGTE